MFNKIKYSLRNKLISSTKEGNSDVLEKLSSIQNTIDNLEGKINSIEYKMNLMPVVFNSPEFYLTNNFTTKKRVLICGFYGARNLGDELMLQSLLSKLDRSRLDITILLAKHTDKDASIYSPYKVVHYPQCTDDILNIAHNYDCLIWGGGAVIDESNYRYDNSNTPLGYILLKASIAMINSEKDVYVFGVSTNKTISDQAMINDLKYVISRAKFFSLRDANSLITLQNADIDTTNIKIIDDLAISILPTHSNIAHKKNGTIEIGIILINMHDNIKHFKKLFTNILTYFADEKVHFHLIPFYDHADSDVSLYKNIAQELKISSEDYVVEKYSNNIQELTAKLQQCNLIFSMRYHGTLISSIFGLPTISIDFSDIHAHYYNKLRYIKSHYCPNIYSIKMKDIEDTDAVGAAISEVMSSKNKVDSAHIIESAKKQLTALISQI